MKATGIIRRIDDLGRIVIPKEIRKNLRIKNGENLEIFTSENENIILRKYNQIDKLQDLAKEISESIYSIIRKNVIITNTESIISVSGQNKKIYENEELSEDIIKKLYNRKEIFEENKIPIKIIKEKEENISYAFAPILANGDLIGSIIIYSNENLTASDLLITKIVANILAYHIEG